VREWSAEVDVDEDLARRLIGGQFPEVELASMRLLGEGWDALAGVIDWGDICRGDPSIDLSLLWSFFPPNGRSAFLDAYGPVTADQLLRARVLALCLCAVLALYAHHEGMVGVEGEALDGLERTVA
jgi:hypothetical protein